MTRHKYYYSPYDAAKYIGLSEKTIRDLVRAGKIQAIKRGRITTFIHIAELQRTLANHLAGQLVGGEK
jgi:excisionase family DNA binding protein